MPKPLRVLIVEDSPDDAELLVRELRRAAFDVSWRRVESRSEMEDALIQESWDIIVSDYSLPSFDGLAAIRLAKQRAPDLPFILVSGTVGEDVAVEAMKAGAHDYILKDRLARFAPAVRRELAEAQIKIDRRQAREDLRRSQDTLEQVLNSIPQAIFWKDREGRYLGCNSQFARLAGSDDFADVVGKTDYDLPWGDFGADDFRADDQEVLASGSPKLRIQEQVRRADGKIIWANTSKIPLLDSMGHPYATLGVLDDVTEQREAADALQSSEERFSAAFRGSPIPASLSRMHNSEYTEVNDAWCQALGFSQEEVLGSSPATLGIISDDSRAEQREIFMEQGRLRDFETTVMTKAGRRLQVLTSVETLRIGGQDFALNMFIDITQRKEAESAVSRLLENQRLINALALTLGDEIAVEATYETVFRHVRGLMDVDSFIISYYDAAEQLFRAGYVRFGEDTFDVSQLPPIPLEEEGHGTQSRVVHTSAPLYLPDYRKARETGKTEYNVDDDGNVREGPPPVEAEDVIRSALFVPLKHEGKVVGVMQVQSSRLDGYSQADIDLLAGLANVTAVALSNSRLVEQIQMALDRTIRTLAEVVELRDPYTAGHQRRVANLACAIADRMGLSPETIKGVEVAGLLHDIGKIAVPAEILSKPSRLTKVEYSMLQSHSRIASDLLQSIDFPWPVAQIVHQHHERMDGAGYPQGLKGEDILIEARILAVADTVEAMAAHRPYRPALGIDTALEEIQAKRGTLYDVDVVDACVELFESGEFRFQE